MTLHGNGDFQQLFAQQARREDSEIELDLAALYLAGEEYPDLDLAHYLNLLDRIATEVDEAAAKVDGDTSLVDSLNRYFFDLQGYSGNAADYYNPDNSYLNRVLDTRQRGATWPPFGISGVDHISPGRGDYSPAH